MPTYEYECRACGHSFERTQSMSEEPVKDCPACGKDVRRVINGGAGIIFKGSGFYVNDSKGKNSTASTTSKTGSQTSEPSGSDSGKSGSGESAATASAPADTKADVPAKPKAGAKESA